MICFFLPTTKSPKIVISSSWSCPDHLENYRIHSIVNLVFISSNSWEIAVFSAGILPHPEGRISIPYTEQIESDDSWKKWVLGYELLILLLRDKSSYFRLLSCFHTACLLQMLTALKSDRPVLIVQSFRVK